MVGELKNRVILVTGASEGIGASISRKLAELGATLVLCSRNIEKLQLFAEDKSLSGSNLTLINQDLATSAGVEKCVELLIQKHGRIDAIINNVGGAIGRGVFDDLSDDNWLDTYLVNVMSLVRLTRLLKPYLIQSSHARIVTISSVNASEPGFENPHYSSSKAALANLTKYLANSLSSSQVTVNSISPGTIRTDGFTEWIKTFGSTKGPEGVSEVEVLMQNIERRIPMGVVGEGEVVADMVAFLVSDKARWITGSNFRLDGGKNRHIF
jgi:NAD(P)-dependent dehydrogenase (short-subunit alcohol dehydrogenase family)